MQEELVNEAMRNTLGKLQISHYLADYPHHIPPCHNLHKNLELDDEDTIADITHFFKPFPYVCSYPVPILQAAKLPRKVLNGLDPVTSIIREKMKWEKRKKIILKVNKKDMKHINPKLLTTALSSEGNRTLLPRGVCVLAEHLQADPDPRFSGSYNWYYSGGNLTTFKHLEETYLVCSHALNPGILTLAKLSQNENVLEMTDALEPFSLGTEGIERKEPVFEIVHDRGRIAARQKTQIHILKTGDEDGKMKLNSIHSIQSKQSLREGFVSVALASHAEGDYCVLSNYGILRLYQLDKSEKCVCSVKIQKGEGIVTSDNWGSIHYSEPNLLLLTDRCCVHLLDHRCGLAETQVSWCPKKLCENCEEISICVPSSIRSHVQYVGTNHQAFSLDIRSGFMQRWTHLLPISPYIGFSAGFSNSCEMLLMAGQAQRSVCSIVNTWKEDVSVSCNLPFTLTSPVESLQTLRCHGNCLEPSLLSRCDLSLTGITHVPMNNGLFILRSNSVGDVFCQQLQDKRCVNACAPPLDESFSKWQVTSDAEPVRANATDDFGDIFEIINKWQTSPMSWSQSKLSKCKPSDEDWRVSKSYLENCVDMLAAPLLAVWEVQDEPEWECVKEATVEVQDPAEKVLNWLGSGTDTELQLHSQLPEPLEIKNKITETDEIIDTPNLSFSYLERACNAPSPAHSRRSMLSGISARSAKPINLSQSVLENSHRQTPKKKYVSGF